MTAPDQTTAKPASTSGPGRRIAACLIVSALVFLTLWLMAFSLVTALLISSGVGVTLIATSAVLELVATVLDIIATVLFAILAAIAAVIAFVFSFFS
jgi:hypothetical protein